MSAPGYACFLLSSGEIKMLFRQRHAGRAILTFLGLSVLVSACSLKGGSVPPPDKGNLAFVNDKTIEGWAWNRADPEGTVKVDLFDGETLLGTVVADRFRQDLLEVGVGDGRHGFRFPTPDVLKDGEPHSVRAIISGTEIELGGSPKMYEHQGS
jgi:hypothetical protein